MTEAATQTNEQAGNENVPALAGPRLPYHPAIEERFGVDRASWKALVEAIFPGAQSTESVILALSYCRARNLDPFKRNVHIVPIWDSKQGRMVDTVWPGIGELRTTAFRTGKYGGREATVFGDVQTAEWDHQPRNGPKRTIKITFPEWAQVTVYRVVNGERVAFAGPRVYWLETYSTMGKSDAPNSMWERRPRGQLDKCAEAAALRAAFPEEIGDEFSNDEVGIIRHRDSITQGEGQQAFDPNQSKAAQLASRIQEPNAGGADEGEPQPTADADEPSPTSEPAGGDAAAEGAGGEGEQVNTDTGEVTPAKRKGKAKGIGPNEQVLIQFHEANDLSYEAAKAALDSHCEQAFGKGVLDLKLSELSTLQASIKKGEVAAGT